MSDFFDDDEYPEMPVPTPEQFSHARELEDKLRFAAQRIGLYSTDITLASAVGLDGKAQVMLLTTFTPGDVAWSARIQEPEQHKMDEEFRSIEDDLAEDEFEQYRRQLAKERGIEEETDDGQD